MLRAQWCRVNEHHGCFFESSRPKVTVTCRLPGAFGSRGRCARRSSQHCRLDVLEESGQLDRLLRSGLRYCRQVKVLDAHAAGETEPVSIIKTGPELVFGRLWQDMGIGELISQLAAERRYGFDLERAVYLTVLHRLFVSGSDRAAEAWKENYS